MSNTAVNLPSTSAPSAAPAAPAPAPVAPATPPAQAKPDVARSNSAIRAAKFGPGAVAAKQSIIDSLRLSRGVTEPHTGAAHQPYTGPEAATQTGSAPAETPNAPVQAPQAPVSTSAADPVASLQAKWAQQQLELDSRAAKAQAAEAQAAAKHAEAARMVAEAEAKLAKIDQSVTSPLEYMAATGMSEDDFRAFLTNGGQLTPDQKRVRALEKQIADQAAKMAALEQKQQQAATQAQISAENARFAPVLAENYPVALAIFGNVDNGLAQIRNKANQMRQATGLPVTLEQAAQALEENITRQMKTALTNEKARSKIGIDSVNKSIPAAPVEAKPTATLGSQFAGSTEAQSRPAPTDWAGKRALALQRLRAEALARR